MKRKVAGLPPVTKEWFDSRKEQLSSSAAALSAQKIWLDPLTKKRFSSENTYTAFVRSKKYQDLVRKSGSPAPAPVVSIRKPAESGMHNSAVRASLTRILVVNAGFLPVYLAAWALDAAVLTFLSIYRVRSSEGYLRRPAQKFHSEGAKPWLDCC